MMFPSSVRKQLLTVDSNLQKESKCTRHTHPEASILLCTSVFETKLDSMTFQIAAFVHYFQTWSMSVINMVKATSDIGKAFDSYSSSFCYVVQSCYFCMLAAVLNVDLHTTTNPVM